MYSRYSRAPLGATLFLVMLAMTVLIACNRPGAPRVAAAEMDIMAAVSPSHEPVNLTPLARQQLADLRVATSPYHDIEEAKAMRFVEITGCMSDPAKGGMGVHYGMMSRFDGKPEHNAPEMLVYEPAKNGKLRLVGIEFAVPLDAWTSPNPPELFGQQFHKNTTFGLWVLHAWVWKDNPSGMFADYNPKVSCDDANE